MRTYRAALVADAKTADDATAIANLPAQANSPVDSNANMWLTLANGDALGNFPRALLRSMARSP